MKETMGQVIRRLRKERELTQEGLAEQLGVTSQAISKWENNMGMPDVSQIVPLANLFGVSTDTLFGIADMDDREAVARICRNAQSKLTKPMTAEGFLAKYRVLQEGVKQYPNSPRLLLETLEAGLPLSYPEHGDLYDPAHGEAIYRECVRYANRLISCSKNVSEIMRAHMISVMLHAAHGNMEEANAHAKQFPYRADFNIHVMYAYCAYWKGDYDTEAASCKYAVAHYLESLLNVLDRLARSYMKQGRYKDAADTLETAFSFIECAFKNNDFPPPIHYRGSGDLYLLLAEAHLGAGNTEKAVSTLEKMIDYDVSVYPRLTPDMKTQSPILSDIPINFYQKRLDRYQPLPTKLTSPGLTPLQESPAYQTLLSKVKK